MSKQVIRIDRLEIRLRHIAPETARAAVSGLGQHLLDQLASERLPTRKRNIRIARLDQGNLKVAAGAGPAELRSAIGKKITNSIRGKLR